MSFRVSYHDVAARVTANVPRERLARAIERLSGAYREGRSVDVHRSAEGRAAYLVHVMPAHVCDVRRLLLDELEEVIRKEELRVVALGAGPGTEAVALADAWVHLSLRDGAPPGKSVHVTRVDRVQSWDDSWRDLREAALAALAELDPTLGPGWTLDAPDRSLACDLLAPLAPPVLEAIGRADLVIAANLVSELEPRGTPTLPAGFVANLEAMARAARAGATFVFLDRGHAPGVVNRLAATVEALARVRPARKTDLYEREVRCACSVTRATKALYAKVRLPTTKVEDRPIGSTRTAWGAVTFGDFV